METLHIVPTCHAYMVDNVPFFLSALVSQTLGLIE